MTRLLVLDNYDSFTWNLVQYAREAGAEPHVFRSDELSVPEALSLAPDAILISPGPGTPADAGICVPLIRAAGEDIPVLGVCLGHQAIAAAYGGKVDRAARPMHGKATNVVHSGKGLFSGIPSPFRVMRYHSLVVRPEALPADLEPTAWSRPADSAAEIMALRHRRHPIFGVQFHPESVGTEHGHTLLRNFLSTAARSRLQART